MADGSSAGFPPDVSIPIRINSRSLNYRRCPAFRGTFDIRSAPLIHQPPPRADPSSPNPSWSAVVEPPPPRSGNASTGTTARETGNPRTGKLPGQNSSRTASNRGPPNSSGAKHRRPRGQSTAIVTRGCDIDAQTGETRPETRRSRRVHPGTRHSGAAESSWRNTAVRADRPPRPPYEITSWSGGNPPVDSIVPLDQ